MLNQSPLAENYSVQRYYKFLIYKSFRAKKSLDKAKNTILI